MKILSVSGMDFLALDEVQFRLNDRGLVLVQGENRDDTAAKSNGAGKSSLVDLICWTLWGMTARGSSGDAVIREGRKGCIGSLILQDVDCEYEIVRSRKKGKTSLAVSQNRLGITSDLTQGTEKLTQAVVAKILGCSEEVFRASIYMGQEQLVDLPRMTDKQLKLAVEEAAGVDVLERAYEQARARMSVALVSFDDARDKHAKVETKIGTLDSLIASESANAETWKRAIANQIDGIESDLSVTRARYFKLTEEISHANGAVIWANDKLAELKSQLDRVSEDRRRETELQNTCSKAERAVAIKANTLKASIERYKMEKQSLEDINTKIGEPCSECGTTLAASHICATTASISARIARIAAQMRAEQVEHAQAVETAKLAATALSAHRDAMLDPSEIISAKTPLDQVLLDQADRVKQAASLRADIARFEEGKRKHEALANPHLAKLVEFFKEKAAYAAQLSGLHETVEQAEALIADLKTVVEVFSPSGVRAHILDTVTPYLNARTSEYLGVLSDGVISASWSTLVKSAKGELREKFSIEVAHTAGSRGFNELSGGEKRKVRLACAMALQDLVASRASKPISLWVCDEVDDALDNAGLERLTSVLQEKVKLVGTVLVISHNALESYIPTVWTMVKQDKKSRLEIA